MLADLVAEAVALAVILLVIAGGIGFVAGWWARGR
jgi:hypothetical protein